MVEQWNLEIRGCLDTSSFKGKSTGQTEKPRGKTEGHEGKRESGAAGDAWSCVPGYMAVRPPPRAVLKTLGSPVVAPAQSCLYSASLLCRLLFLARGTCYAMPMLSHFWGL